MDRDAMKMGSWLELFAEQKEKARGIDLHSEGVGLIGQSQAEFKGNQPSPSKLNNSLWLDTALCISIVQ